MDKNKEFNQKIELIESLIERLTDYVDYYISVERTKELNHIVGCGTVFYTHFTLENYIVLKILIEVLNINDLCWIQSDILQKVSNFSTTLNDSLDEKIELEEAEKISIDVQLKEGLYLLYLFYLILDNDSFNTNYLKYLDNQEDLIGIKSTIKRFLNDSRYEKIAYLIESDNDKE